MKLAKSATLMVLTALLMAACSPPTPEPTATPLPPTDTAIPDPTAAPTDVPTEAPTEVPTEAPTDEPTAESTAEESTGESAAPEAPAATDTTEPTSEPLAQVFITFRDFEIVPAVSTVKVGQPVVFLIESASGANHQPYTPGFQNPGPNDFEAPSNLVNGTSFTFTFSQAGPVTLLCGFHDNMVAQLIVEP
ncbi:MAG: hypothetical protein ACE5FI_07575 [Anaerolineales bacterium]